MMRRRNFPNCLRFKPDAVADIEGSSFYPEIEGVVKLYQTRQGVILVTDVIGLPITQTNIFAFHIHSGERCTGNDSNPFSEAGAHYNPTNTSHPNHAGDLPPLFSNNGFAWQAVLTDRFKLKDVINKAIIIHINPDDFKTQPSGDSGVPIACGIIRG